MPKTITPLNPDAKGKDAKGKEVAELHKALRTIGLVVAEEQREANYGK